MRTFGSLRFGRTFGQDYAFGKANEVRIHPDLNAYFGPLNHNQNQMAPFDFENETMAVEVKSRTCRFSDYADTMLQYTKIENCYLPAYADKEKWFVFAFTDGVYGIKYDETVFQKYTQRMMKIPDRVSIVETEKNRIFIDTDDLVCISSPFKACLRP
jgi:hypothetical protein